MGIEIPESTAAPAASFFHSVLAVEALSRVDPSVGVLVDVQNTLVINALLRWGNERAEAALPAASWPRTTVGAYALSEAGSGSDAFALTTRATENGDGFALTGRKLWITNGNEADIFIVFANVNPEAGYRGITAFLVERGTPGFTVGKKEDKLGIRASSTCELIFEDCVVPEVADVLGEVGKGYKVAIETLNEGRIGIGAQMLGLAQGALDHTDQLHQGAQAVRQGDRRLPGRAVPARAHGDRVEAARLLVYNAARLRDAGLPFLRSGDVQAVRVGGGRARRLDGGQPVRRLRLREGLPGREAVSRREDRPDLRRHVQHAAADDRQESPRLDSHNLRCGRELVPDCTGEWYQFLTRTSPPTRRPAGRPPA